MANTITQVPHCDIWWDVADPLGRKFTALFHGIPKERIELHNATPRSREEPKATYATFEELEAADLSGFSNHEPEYSSSAAV